MKRSRYLSLVMIWRKYANVFLLKLENMDCILIGSFRRNFGRQSTVPLSMSTIKTTKFVATNYTNLSLFD